MSNESEDTELPNLRFLGQIPINSKHDAKRAKPDSSPSTDSLDVFLSKIDKIASVLASQRALGICETILSL